jgi:hypothetical protein
MAVLRDWWQRFLNWREGRRQRYIEKQASARRDAPDAWSEADKPYRS